MNTKRLTTAVVATFATVIFLYAPVALASETLFQYHPDSFNGYSWGCQDPACNTINDTAEFRWFPTDWSALDKFCFDMTFTYADQVTGTVKFTARPQYFSVGVWDYSSLIQDILLHGTTGSFNWLTMLPGNGSWSDVPSNFTTKSFDTYWTPSSSGSGVTRDNVCFDIEKSLGTSLGLPSKYPMRIVVTMANADKYDCRTDIGNTSRCYVFKNSTAPYSSVSLGFSFKNLGSMVNQNATMAGEITGWGAKTIYIDGLGAGTDLQNFPASTSYGFETRDFGVLGNMFRDVIVWSFFPQEADVPDFGNLASAVQNKPPVGYWTLARSGFTGLATSSYTAMDNAYSATKAVVDPLKAGLNFIVYIAGLYYMYRRLTHIEL